MRVAYRAEIDGLRAVAIAPVVLFHAGVPGLPGGFIGVDVFFVISGYLITGILHREIIEGRYSLARFYERRVRRIVPALAAVLAATALLGPLLLLPSQLERLPAQILGTLGFMANVIFWRRAGYFGPEAEDLPLLHMWSLGVEEQFYILMPLVLAATCRWQRARLPWVIGFLLLVSFSACAMLTPLRPEASFYLLPNRAWELLAGAWVGLGLVSVLNGPTREVLAWAGLACIALAIAILDERMNFPGYVALLPVGGAVLVTAYAEGTSAGRLLSLHPMVALGLVSYSLYLWHWPMIVFAHGARLMDGPRGVAGVVVASVLVATLSWRVVEQPFRHGARVPRPSLLAFAGSAAALLAGAAVLLKVMGPAASLASARVVTLDAARTDFSAARARCHRPGGLPPPKESCVLGQGPARLVVWGDSMGVEVADALSERMALQVITYSACPPALGYEPVQRPLCRAHNDQVIAHLLSRPELGTVLLAANHAERIDDQSYREGLRRAVGQLEAAGRQVLVLGALPSIGVDVPTYLARGYSSQVPRGATTLGDGRVAAFLDGLDGALVVDPSLPFCGSETCSLLTQDRPILFDDRHPSMTAARLIAAEIEHALRAPGLETAAGPALAFGD